MQGLCLLRLHRTLEAIEAFKAQVYYDPHSIPGWLDPAQAQLDAGRPQDALVTLHAARQRGMWSDPMELILARACEATGDLLGAVAAWERVRPTVAPHTVALVHQARCFIALHRPGDAAATLAHAAQEGLSAADAVGVLTSNAPPSR